MFIGRFQSLILGCIQGEPHLKAQMKVRINSTNHKRLSWNEQKSYILSISKAMMSNTDIITL